MTMRMLIDARHREETRVAVVKGNRIEEFDFESAEHKQLKGNIYLAKVTRVEPSLQAAFVDYGGNRHGFLAFSEIHPDYYQIPREDREALLREERAHAEEEAALRADYDEDEDAAGDDGVEVVEATHHDDEEGAHEAEASEGESNEGGRPNRRKREKGDDAADELRRKRMALRRRYKIQDVIKRRQVLLVQVVKEERGNKGAALTTYLSLAGRYCVLMPNTSHGGGISRKISNAADRKRLKSIIAEMALPSSMGCIVRTAGLQRTKPEIKRDFDYLARLWDGIREETLKSTAPALVYGDSDLLPQAHQIFIVAADLGPGPLAAGGADDQAGAFRHLHLAGDFLQLLAVDGIGDLATDAATARGVGHQDAIAARQRQIGGQRGTLVATLFLDDLDQHDLPDLDHFLDLVATRARLFRRRDFFRDVLFGDRFDLVVVMLIMVIVVMVVVAGRLSLAGGGIAGSSGLLRNSGDLRLFRFDLQGLGDVNSLGLGGVDDGHTLDLIRRDHGIRRDSCGLRTTAAARVALGPLGLFGFGDRSRAFFLDQRFAIRSRDLVVIRMDLGKGQKAMAIAAIFDKGRLQGGLDPRHLRQIDIASKLSLVDCLEIKFLDFCSVHHDNPGLLGMCSVDQHFL